MITTLGLNKIYPPGIVQQRKPGNVVSFKGTADTFEAQTHFLYGNMHSSELEEILKVVDKNKKLNSGFTSDIFSYHNCYIIKCPKTPPKGATLPDSEIAKNLKEFFILREIEKINPDIAVHAFDVINRKGIFYLVEKFVNGIHPQDGNMNENHIRDLLPKLTELDKNSIVNCDLQCGNIFLTSQKSTRLIDFGSYSFLDNYGNIIGSDYLPQDFFKLDMKVSDLISMPVEKRFARTFIGHDKFYDIKNLADNPYLNSDSNISNFEFRTLYKYLLEDKSEKSLEFFKSYVKTKGQVYHAQMEDFLKTLNIEEIEELIDKNTPPEVIKNAKINLQKAIHYEGIAKEVLEDPSDKVLKTELAKIQLKKFLDPDLYVSPIPGSKKIQNAYNGLMALLHQYIDTSDAKEKEYFTETLNCIEKRFKDYKFEPGQVDIPDEENLIKHFFSAIGDNAKPEEKIEEAIDSVRRSNKKIIALAAGGAGIAFAGIMLLRRKNKKVQEIQNTPAPGKTDNIISPFQSANKMIADNMPDIFSKTVLKK